MTAQMIAVDAESFAQMQRSIDNLTKLVEGATIIPKPEWVSVKAFAELKDVHPNTVRRWIDSGRIEARGSGKARQVRCEP